jgi:hypothetical protein
MCVGETKVEAEDETCMLEIAVLKEEETLVPE